MDIPPAISIRYFSKAAALLLGGYLSCGVSDICCDFACSVSVLQRLLGLLKYVLTRVRTDALL